MKCSNGVLGLVLFIFSGCAARPSLTSASDERGEPNSKELMRMGTWDPAKLKRILGLPEDPYLTPIPDAPDIYREAFDLLEKREYARAEELFQKMLRLNPTSNWTLAAQFNLARALEGLGRNSDALTVYRSVAQNSSRAQRLQGLALLRTGILFETLGEDDKSLAAFKDAERRSRFLPLEVAQTELPARLAAAYARERNFAEAERYYRLAESQLARLRAKIPAGDQPEWIPRILYSMGHRSIEEVTWERFESSLVPLERSQIYLLQAAEVGISPWAQQAAEELIGNYTVLRKSIDAVPVPAASEIVIAAREQQKERWRRLIRLSDALESLKSLFVTEIVKSVHAESALRKIVDFAEEFEENLQTTLMLERPAGESETPESARRREDRRPRLIEAKPIFPGEGSASSSKASKDQEKDGGTVDDE
jgi:tetratricopeptide (TPR) repeat protein